MVEGAPHTAKERSRRSTYVSMGCPLPPYIKEWRRGRASPLYGAPSLAGRPLPLAPLYTGAGGHPRTHKLIFVIVP